jgi:2-dehydro-3-deoxygalactonokinase
LFAALGKEGILTDGGNGAHAPDVFRNAVGDAAGQGASLPHLLFTVRSRTVRGLMRHEDAASRLSGLIIGADVAGALRLIGGTVGVPERIAVIGMPELGARYVDALNVLGVTASLMESRTATIAGSQQAGGFLD